MPPSTPFTAPGVPKSGHLERERQVQLLPKFSCAATRCVCGIVSTDREQAYADCWDYGQRGVGLVSKASGGGTSARAAQTAHRHLDFPDTETGRQVRPIGTAALAHIQAQPKRETCPYVFPSEFADGHLVGLPRILARVCTTARIEGVTLPTLRHTLLALQANAAFQS